ncbi:MAG: ATP-binding protein, partial [Dehalococcoidia bacterium]
KIVPRFNWDDIILPGDRLAQLHEIANYVLFQHVVYEQWRVGGNSTLGRGVATLFAGQSGTGKTMASEVIANDLGLELYKIDLAGLVSKYIGETEKNLAKIFEEAGDTNAILFFDEADAVFGKRTEVKDSHDRYANIEVSYLLQKIEEYDGIVVLATNLRSNLDEAFLRRMRAIVEFPFPEVDDRLRIWQHMMRTDAPVAEDVDLAFMARQFRIAGGNIRNVVLFAAFLAASEGKSIGMSHLIQGTKREYQKLGRLVTESDFGRWYEQVRA